MASLVLCGGELTHEIPDARADGENLLMRERDFCSWRLRRCQPQRRWSVANLVKRHGVDVFMEAVVSADIIVFEISHHLTETSSHPQVSP